MSPQSSIPWNAYPALLAATCFASGICIQAWLAPPLLVWVALMAVGAFTLRRRSALPGERVPGSDELVLTAAALAGVLASGAVRLAAYESMPADHIVRSGFDHPVTVTGKVTEASVIGDGVVRLVLAVRSGERPPDGTAPWRGRTATRRSVSSRSLSSPTRTAMPARGLLQIAIRGMRTEIEVCDLLLVNGELRPLPRARNPGDFDYGTYLRRRKIHARMFISSGDVRRAGRVRDDVRCLGVEARSAVGRRIERYVRSPDARAVLRALLLGDRGAIAPDVRARFARTGLLHLLAVSGLHVMIVGMILYRLLGPALMRAGCGWRLTELIRSTCTGTLLLGYMVLTGCSPSVVRAVVMTLLFMTAGAAQRTGHSLNTLGAAALLLLAVRPVNVFEPGFQLSVAAVAAIIGLTPQISAWLPATRTKLGGHVRSSITVTTAATLGTLPIVLAHFGRAATGGLLLNLPAVPITTAALSSGIAAVAAGELWMAAGLTLGASADLLARLLLGVSEVGDRYLGWSLLQWNLEHPAPIVALALAVVAIGFWRHPHHRWPLLLTAAAVLTVHLWFDLGRRTWIPHLDVIFLDVGQGDAALAILPNKKVLLIDAGPRTMYSDAGVAVIRPQLERMGIRRIDTAVITHPDSDHLGGLPSLLRSVPVGRVVRSGFVHDSKLYRETNHVIDSLGIAEQHVTAGDTLDLDPAVRAFVLHPHASTAAASPNAHSIVLRLQYGSTGLLFAGDAPADAELRMIRSYRDLLPADVLKVGHHGSRTSSTPAFLSSVRRRGRAVAVISVAERNRFGLPDEDVLMRLRRLSFDVHTTASTGAVRVRLDGRRMRLVDR